MFRLRKQTKSAPLSPADPEESRAIAMFREELVVLNQPRSAIAEQYRALRNSVQALNPDGAPRTVVLTSAIEGEGKTVATLNLALAFAELPRVRVLVVDADLHTPAVERYLGQPERQGLAELLRGDLPLDQAVRPTAVQGFSFIGSGAVPDKPSELLGSQRVRTLLSSLKQRYDYILIDTPAALSINDAAMLGALADGVLLVVRLNSTPRHLVEQAYNVLETMGGNLLGTCLTGA